MNEHLYRPNMQLGSYRLIERIGAGGMGEVWRAEDSRLLRHVAIKILPSQLASDGEWKERFLREARTVAQLNHPNIATIYAIDQQQQSLFIAMELIEGEPLSTMIARGPLRAAEAVHIATQVCAGLSEAHEKGIIHRDIKPDNILVSRRVVKILDFGIAKTIGGTADPGLTQGGMVMGTPFYMSPEQAMAKAVDARTDIFSLGVVLYEMLCAHKPFSGDAATEVLLKIVMQEPLDITNAMPGIPPGLAAVVRRCMKKQADDRYAKCDDLRHDLAQALREESAPARASVAPSAPAAAPRQSRKSDPRMAMPPKRTSPAASAASAPGPAGPRRALVADDDPATRYLLGSVLERHQIPFDEAANGADAVKFLKNNAYTLVFLDLFMPRVDGWGVLDYLRGHHRAKMPRTFIVTGVLNQKLSAADQDIVTALLFKPIDVAQVETLVAAK